MTTTRPTRAVACRGCSTPRAPHPSRPSSNARTATIASSGTVTDAPIDVGGGQASSRILRARISSVSDEPVRVLFVCLGNICRSPTAEAVMRHHVSATRSGWMRSRSTARARVGGMPGIRPTSGPRPRRPGGESRWKAPLARCTWAIWSTSISSSPWTSRTSPTSRIWAIRPSSEPSCTCSESSTPTRGEDLDVPDPYYGGPSGFADVFDLVDASCRGLLEQLRDMSP